MTPTIHHGRLDASSETIVFLATRKPVASPGLDSESTSTARKQSERVSLISSPSTSGDDLPAEIATPNYRNSDKAPSLAQLKDWWWEMGACVIAITGCGLLIFMLKFLDQKPLSFWIKLWSIEPNTVLAVISTVSRTAMMVPVTSCLSQLKWRHFQRKPHRLSHLDLIDRSSRGPWGSFQVLLRLGRANVIISILAVTTILSLAIGPSVQQILETRNRTVPAADRLAQLSCAKMYTSRAASKVSRSTIELKAPEHYEFLSALVRGIVNPVPPDFVCNAEICSWPKFTTLGMCAFQEDLTETTVRTCGPLWQQTLSTKDGTTIQDNSTWAVACTYKLPAHSYDFSAADMVPYTNDTGESSLEFDWIFRSLAHAQLAGYPDIIYDPQFLTTQTYWGEANLSIHEGKPEEKKIRLPMPVIVAEILATDPRYPSDPAGPPNVSVRRVLFYLCAQTYPALSAMPAAMRVPRDPIFSEPLMAVKDRDYLSPDRFQVPSTGEIMQFGNSSHIFVFELIYAFFSTLSASVDFETDSNNYGEHMLTLLHYTLQKTLGPWMWRKGVDRAIRSAATTVTSLIRNNKLGDNMDAQMLEGVAWEGEVYFSVRWVWITVIVVETLCVTTLLAISIAISWRDSLFKDSSFALLAHGLECWETLRVSGPGTMSSLDEVAKGMVAKLEADEDGVLKFRRQDERRNADHGK